MRENADCGVFLCCRRAYMKIKVVTIIVRAEEKMSMHFIENGRSRALKI